MMYRRLDVMRFKGYVMQVVFSESFDKQEFEATEVENILFSVYQVGCDYEDLIGVLDRLVEAGRLVCLIPQRRYKIKPMAAKV